MNDPVLAFLEQERPAMIERLLAFVRVPSVSTDPTYVEGMKQARAVLSSRLREVGMRNVHEIDAGGHPAVYGDWLGVSGGPTLLVYGHYDVQPPDPLDKWVSPPFDPQIRDDRIYGRGVSDDKGPSAIALETLAAFLSVERGIPVNVKLLLEGEEELGSPTLGALCRKHADLLSCDAVLSADGASWRHDLPTVNVGTRGNAGFEVSVETAAKDLHSGRFGGAVPNALHVLARLVADLHTPDGAVAVPGFHEGISVSEMDRAALKDLPFDESAFFASIGSQRSGEPGYSTLERLWLRPCLDVNGMWGGYTGPGGKTVIPNQAHAKITIRVVPGQDAGRICQYVKDFLSQRCPEGVTLRFGADRGQSPAYELRSDHPLLLAAEWALEQTYGMRPRRIRIGGTLPLAAVVRQELGVDTVMFSFSSADEDFHAPNEFFRLSSLDRGLQAWTAILRRFGETTRSTLDYE